MPDVPSALPRAEAARLRGDEPETDDELGERLRSLTAALGKDALGEAFAVRLEARLWTALDRCVSLLERKLDVAVDSDVTGEAEAISNLVDAMDRLGMLTPVEHDVCPSCGFSA